MAKSFVRLDYAHIKDYEKRCKKAALDHSNDGKCWWVYKHIITALGVGQRGEQRYVRSHGNKEYA